MPGSVRSRSVLLILHDSLHRHSMRAAVTLRRRVCAACLPGLPACDCDDRFLDVRGNQLSGTIPESLGSLTGLA
jgi:hypothetical protein